ncbi:MAG: hypothetical protein HQK89_01625 [Nitrospirae bacterium]|nr:hypothetical protein [Nitrospirota bacterium]
MAYPIAKEQELKNKMPHAALSKITAPSIQKVIERNDCFKSIDLALQRRVLWVSAPGGAGKTTLAASYIESRRASCLWYHLDEADVDAATFFHYMNLAVKTLSLHTKIVLPEFTKEYIDNVPSFATMYFERLFAALAGHTGKLSPLIMVLDNYQDVPAGSPVHDVIGRGLFLMPEGINAIITSRGQPPVEFTRLRINQDMHFIGWDDLVFTIEETFELVKISVQREVPEGVVRELHEKTGGWVAGLILAIEGGFLAGTIARFEDSVTKDMIFDYFAREILERAGGETREFLLKTSYLPEFDVSMAEKLTGCEICRKILSAKPQQYFLTEKLTQGGPMFQYHGLFREFLLARARNHFGQRQNEIMSLAADILEENGYVGDGARLCMETANVEKLGNIILKNAPSMIAGGRRGILDNWFSSIPDEFLRNRPWLLHWKGMHLLSANPADAREILESAYVKFKSLEDTDGMLLTFCAIVDSFVYEWKDFHPLDYWIVEFEELSKRSATRVDGSATPAVPSASGMIRERVTVSIFTALLFQRPGHRDISYWLGEAEKIMWNSQNHVQRMALGHSLIMYHHWMGRIIKAGIFVEALSPIVGKMKEHALPQIMFLRSEALYMVDTADHEPALKSIEKGLKLAEESGEHGMDLMLFHTALYHCLAIGESEAAGAYLRKITRFVNAAQYIDMMYYRHTASLEALSRGDFASAGQHGALAVKLAEESGCIFIHGIYEYTFAYILAETGHFADARSHIAGSLNIVTATGSSLFTYLCTFVEALIALYENDKEQFSYKLTNGIAMCKASGLRFMFFMQSSMERLCRAAIDRKIETDYIKEIIRLNNLTPGNRLCDDWPYPLKIYTLGGFLIEKDGKTVSFTGKTQDKPLEMLKAVIACGGKEVDAVMITGKLWADSDSDAASITFRSTLHRLRKLLGENDVITYADRRVTLNPKFCWVDIWAFDNVIGEIDNIYLDATYNGRQNDSRNDSQNDSRTSEEHVRYLFGKLFHLYKGDFLPNETDESWSILMRERLKGKFIQGGLKLGYWFECSEKWENAIECYRNAIEIDNLNEQFYQRIMACHQKLGQNAEALSIYNVCRNVLLSTFGVKPSPATEEIRTYILKNSNNIVGLSFSGTHTPS